MSKKKKKSILNREKIHKPKIRPDQDALSAKWGTVSAIAACITAFLSASVLIYTIVQYIQISK
ncbi:MAG: hypothetical protein V2J65_38235 [Desulfobacteraceae bacterium]|nr:hypothetical protein [Desulfobacteraceae bacterium]